MYLDPWMLGTLALVFGFCAWFNHKRGLRLGIITTLEALENDKVIRVLDDGTISPYRAPTYRKRKSIIKN
jgi:hypothetical protein